MISTQVQYLLLVGGVPSVITRISGTDPPNFELIRSNSWYYIILVLSYAEPTQMSIHNSIYFNPLPRPIHTQDYPLFSSPCSLSRARDDCASQAERPPASPGSMLAALVTEHPTDCPTACSAAQLTARATSHCTTQAVLILQQITRQLSQQKDSSQLTYQLPRLPASSPSRFPSKLPSSLAAARPTAHPSVFQPALKDDADK